MQSRVKIVNVSKNFGDVVALNGDLGAGKTVFAKGMARGLGLMDYAHVNSPTFVIMKEYHGDLPLYHFDVYRLEERDFEDTVDYNDYFYGDGISVIEWAEKIAEVLPEDHLEIKITGKSISERSFLFLPHGAYYEKIVMEI